jgi:hypothetical protein
MILFLTECKFRNKDSSKPQLQGKVRTSSIIR